MKKTNRDESVKNQPQPERQESDVPRMLQEKKGCSTGTMIASIVFFAITLVVFVLYEFFSIKFLYDPLINSPGDLGEAIAAVFGYVFGLVMTIIFGIAQLPENIISIILTNRVRFYAENKGKRIVFTILYALSIVMLLVTLLSFALFVLMIALGK